MHPSLAKADTWPLSAVETILLATLGYLVLLIGLVVGRYVDAPEPGPGPPLAPPAPVLAAAAQPQRLVAAPQPVAPAARVPVPSTCVPAGRRPQSYAGEPGLEHPQAFGPPVEAAGSPSVAEVNGELWRRLCGGAPSPGGRVHGPDRRLYVALDAAVNGRDPNRVVSRAQWAAGVDRFIARDALWDRARVVTMTVDPGTATYAMQVRPGNADPLVLRTRLRSGNTSRYLVLPVRAADGSVATLRLRLACGFQPVF